MNFTLPNLPYSFDALEPHIDSKTMQIHHDKHHAAYVAKLNDAIAADTEHESKSLEELVKNAGAISPAVRNNGGGHWNHTFFWETLTSKTTSPSEKLQSAINNDFGNMETMQEKFNTAAVSRFGSGWAWLIAVNGKLQITSTPNQDNPLMDVAEVNGTPLLGVDVWEHAYYLQYQNRRPDYLKAIWNVIDWDKVSSRF